MALAHQGLSSLVHRLAPIHHLVICSETWEALAVIVVNLELQFHLVSTQISMEGESVHAIVPYSSYPA